MAGLTHQLLKAVRLIRYNITLRERLLLIAVIVDCGARGRNDGGWCVGFATRYTMLIGKTRWLRLIRYNTTLRE